MTNDLEAAVAPVAAAFESLGIAYYLAGSVISSHFGVPRATADVDVVAAVRVEHADPLVAILGDAFYADADMVRDAVQHRSMFSATMMKVDVYIANTAFDRSAIAHSQRDTIAPEEPIRDFAIASAEDVVLHKLWAADLGVSDLQERALGEVGQGS